MKLMMVIVLGAFLSTSCSHFGGKSCCKGKNGKKESCDLKMKKKEKCEKCGEQTCMDGNCALKNRG